MLVGCHSTWLFKRLCLTTPYDCRRQLKNWVFSLFFFFCLDNEHFFFETVDFVCSKCSAFSALADVIGLSLVIKYPMCNEVFLFSF